MAETYSYSLSNQDALVASERLYLSDDLADVHFVFTNNNIEEKIPAHKLILTVLSPVFRAMFFGPMKEKKDVLIVDSDADAFKEFLQFFYLRKVSLSMANMETVVRLADKYDIMMYVELACSKLQNIYFSGDEEPDKLNTANVCWGYQLAHYADYYPLLHECEDIIIGSTFEVLKTNAFLQVDQAILENILSLNVERQEMSIFYGVLRWATRACQANGMECTPINFRFQLGNCLKLIRFGQLDVPKFSKLVIEFPELLTADEFQDIVLMITDNDYKPKIFSRYVQHYKWNAEKVLNCQRNAKKVENEMIDCRGQQIILFTSNHAILLGGINCNLNPLCNFDLKVTITEVDAVKPKYIYRRIFEAKENNQLKIKLRKPVLIKPNVRYEIRLHIDKSLVADASNIQMWEPITELNGLQLTFHRNHSFAYDNALYGFISSLDVNLVET